MKLTDFDFELPEELIAKYPAENRTGSRLLHLNGKDGSVQDKNFTDIVDFLSPGDLLVFNDTRVIPARLYGHKSTGGKVEILIERVLKDNSAFAHIKASKSPPSGTEITVEGGLSLVVIGRRGDLFHIKFNARKDIFEILEQHGHMPLPPYIDRPDNDRDKERYQTVYNKAPGAVAAPTAGLHFDNEILDRLKEKGVKSAFVTLHVGAGTFQPVRVDNIKQHKMHAEYACVSQQVVDLVLETKAAGGRVIAVGTTSVRSLESAALASQDLLEPFMDDTEIFIYPGFNFKVVDVLLTNFHLPQSTLIMLISAFAGRDHVLNAYAHAIKERYRFFSYGDAMLISAS